MNIEVIPLKVSMGFFTNYTYIVYSNESNKCIIIDPAHEPDKIEEICSQKNLQPEALLLTHSHLDHVNLVETMVSKYNCRVYINKVEADYYHFQGRNLHLFSTVERIYDFDVDHLPVRAIHTPGHTKGSCCYLIGNYLFTGDTLFIEGCGICTSDGGDPEQMFDSLQYLLETTPKTSLIMPGHIYHNQPGLDFDSVIKLNIYLNIENKEQFVKFRMRENQKNILNFSS